MEKVTIFTQSKKSVGIRLRFRLRDTGGVQLCFRSSLYADADDLSKLNTDGTKKNKKKLGNEKLVAAIADVTATMRKAYQICKDADKVDSQTFQAVTDDLLAGGEGTVVADEKANKELLFNLDKYVADGVAAGDFGTATKAAYNVLRGILQRFLIIEHSDGISYDKFDGEMVKKFHSFVRDEYQFVDRYRGLYTNVASNNVPTQMRSGNTVAAKMKKLRAFFRSLEQQELISRTPFARLTDKTRKSLTREVYDDPICLTKEEFSRLLAYEPSENLKATKQAFVLQCAIGCRIGDFQRLTMKNVAVEEGVPYIHYVASKTLKTTKEEIKTPLVRFAFDIVKQTNLNLTTLRNVGGHRGYGKKIQLLLFEAGIDRECNVTNNEGKQKSLPLYAVASTKLARKTFVEMCKQVQVDNYAAGLHSRGSKAVERYQTNSIKDRFILQTAAFGETLFRVDKDLNVITEQAQEEKPTQSQETAFKAMLAAVATMSQEQKAALLKALAG